MKLVKILSFLVLFILALMAVKFAIGIVSLGVMLACGVVFMAGVFTVARFFWRSKS